MKKLLSALLTVVLLFSITIGLGLTAYAKDYEEGEVIETENADYMVSSSEDKTCVLVGYYSEEKDIVIPSEVEGFTVTEIGWSAFAELELESVVIPNTITLISDSAFMDCANLEKITLPSGIESIGTNVFTGTAYYNNAENWNGNALYLDSYLLTVTPDAEGKFEIKNGTTLIADSAFSAYDYEEGYIACDKITEVVMPDSVQHIGFCAFESCTGLEKITFSKNLKSVGAYAFDGTAFYEDKNNWENDLFYVADKFLCSADEAISGKVVIREGTEHIANGLFMFCENINEVVIPSSVEKIGDDLFLGCTELSKVTIADGVKEIGTEAFLGCSKLGEITIPASVEKIDAFALGYDIDMDSDLGIVKMDSFTIKGYKDTEAQRYAKAVGLKFVALDEEPTTGNNNKPNENKPADPKPENKPETTKPNTSKKSPNTGVSTIALAILCATGTGAVLIKKRNKF